MSPLRKPKYRHFVFLAVVLPSLFSCSSSDNTASPAESEMETEAETEQTSNFVKIPAHSITPVSNPALDLGDIDGDGDNDVVLSGKNTVGPVSQVYLNDGFGRFVLSENSNLIAVGESSVKLEDFDQDGDLDLLLIGNDETSNHAKLYFNDGQGDFYDSENGSIDPLSNQSLDTGDIDGNGDMDVLIAGNTNNKYEIVSYKNIGSGEFTKTIIAQYNYKILGPHGAQLGDLDGDQDLDIVSLFYDETDFNYKIAKYINDGLGGYTLMSNSNVTDVIGSQGYTNFSLADFDNDNIVDMVLVNDSTFFRHWAGSSRILFNDGQGNFNPKDPISLPTSAVAFCTGDIDQNDTQDLVTVGRRHIPSGIYIGSYLAKTEIFLNQNSIFETTDTSEIRGVYSGACILGDINMDGKPDLIITGTLQDVDADSGSDLDFSIYLNNF